MPSLYEFTTPVGDVSSGDFTTLYNASGLTVPNAGAGSVSGNLNVGGNLTVQGSSLLIGPVALQSTLSLPNFTFPSNDGTTYQVLATDGSGNLYWTNVQSIPGATYAIQADTTTGGANLSLVSAFTTDSVKFAGGTNITVTRTNDSTITISSSADDIPNGTAAGQVLTWDGSAWTANSVVTSLASADRFTAEFKNNSSTLGASATFRRNFGSTAYATNSPSTVIFQVDSDSQAISNLGSLGFAYDASNPSFAAYTTIDNFATRTQIAKINTTNVEFNGTNLYLNSNHTGAPSANAAIYVERGTSTDASLTWNETDDRWEFTNDLQIAGDLTVLGNDIKSSTGATAITLNNNSIVVAGDVTINGNDINSNGGTTAITLSGADVTVAGDLAVNGGDITTTQTTASVFNATATTVNAFGAATAINLGAATGTTTIGHNLSINGEALKINADATNADSFLYMKGTGKYLKFDNANNRFQFFGGDIATNYNYLRLDTDDTYPDAGIYLKPTKSLLWNSTASPAPQFEFNDNLYVNGDARVSGDIYVSGYQVDINSPVKGDLITFDGTKFINDNIIQFDSAANRTRFQFNISSNPGAINSAITLIKNTGATNYANGDGTGIAIGVLDNTSATPKVFGAVSGAYNSTGNNELRLRSSTDNFGSVDKTLLAVDDNDLKIKGTEFIFNAYGTGSAAVDAQITVERGTSGTDSYLKWAETNSRWEFGESVYSANNIAAAGNMAVNRDASDADAIVVFYKPTTGTETIRWNKTNNRFELTTDMYVPQATIGNIDIDRTNGTITTNTGDLTLDSTGGTTFINDTLNVDSGTLFVDSANNRVGVNTITPSVELQVGGTMWANTVIAVNGDLGTNGDNIYFNYDDGGAGADSYLTVRRGSNPDVSIRWNESTDRWQDTTDGTNYLNLPNQNLDTTDDVTFSSVIVDGVSTYNTQSTTTTSTAATVISSTSRTTQKVVITITDSVTTEMHVLEALAFRKGTTAYLTTYGEMYTNAALATFTADVSAGTIRILATPASANSTTFKVARISVD